MKTLLKKTLLVSITVVAASSCIKDKAPNPVKKFNPATFKEELKKNISKLAITQPRGYSFVISQNGRLADTCSMGVASFSSIKSNSPMHPDKETNVASVTKTFTAVAVIKLMEKNNIKLDDAIGQWLPKYFNAVQPVKDITFRQLLTHRSGISQSSGKIEFIKQMALNGLDNPAKPKKYANMNFALFRVMIPYMINKTAAQQVEASLVPGQTATFENWLSIQYVKYLQENLFTPIGIAEALCKPGPDCAQALGEGESTAAYTHFDWTQESGGGGYYLSTMEMARFMAFLGNTEKLLTKEQREMMDKNFLGWDTEDSFMTGHGQSYGKDGALQWGAPGMQTLVVKYPGNIELSISVTSWPGDDFRNLAEAAVFAYNDSWE